MLLFMALLACQSGDKDDGDVTNDDPSPTNDALTADADTDADSDADADADADTDADTDLTDTALPTGLNGTPPATPVPLIDDFVAVSRHGDNKGPTDLVGTPTVMWFYPAAATGG